MSGEVELPELTTEERMQFPFPHQQEAVRRILAARALQSNTKENTMSDRNYSNNSDGGAVALIEMAQRDADRVYDAIRALHKVTAESRPDCSHDGFDWPCPTVRLLPDEIGGEESDAPARAGDTSGEEADRG